MPKSKSKKNADFQKVKLKVGRKLQKADNETNTSFKTRTVTVAQNLKSVSSDTGSKKQYNLKHLFTQCRHHNSHVRLDAIDHMKEHLTSSPENIISYLGGIMERISELFLDKDNLVRSANIKLSKFVFAHVSEKQISPFFPLLSAHLSCAMTHIDDDVRLDSLALFDLFLDLYPSHVLSSSSKILPNFIEQISSRKNKLDSNKSNIGDNWSERSLTSNPDSKTSTMKWRIRVLSRIQKLLRIMHQHETTDEDTKRDQSSMVEWSSDGIYIQNFPEYIKNNWVPGKTFSLSTYDNEAKETNSSVNISNLIETLIPLLLECWVESTPASQNRNESGSSLTGSSVSLKYEVVMVLELLLQCTIQSDSPEEKSIIELKRKYVKDINQHLVRHFPYTTENPTEFKKTHGKGKQSNVSSESFNLSVCMIMAHFILNNTVHDKIIMSWREEIINYIREVTKNQKMSQEENRLFINVVKKFIEYFDEGTVELIFNSLHVRLQNISHLSKDKMVLLELLGELSLERRYSDIVSFELKSAFLASLPQLFCGLISDNPSSAICVLALMKKAACQKCDALLEKLEILFQYIWDEKVFMQLCEEWQRTLIDLLYYLGPLDENRLKQVASLYFSTNISEKTTVYLISVVNLRFWSAPDDTSRRDIELQFLFSLITGCTSKTLSKLQDNESYNSKSCPIHIHEDTIDQNYQRTIVKVKVVCNELEKFPISFHVTEAYSNYLSNILSKYSVFPLSSIYGLLHFWNVCKFPEGSEVSDDIQRKLVDIALSLLESLDKQKDVMHETTNTFLQEVWTETELALSKCTKGWSFFYSKLQEIIQDVNEDSVLDMFTFKIVMPLRNEGTRLQFMGSQLRNEIQTLCHMITDRHTNAKSSKIWHELNYLLSLIS